MTVLEHIQHFQISSPETKVVVRDYEEGYNDILQLKPMSIMPKVNAFWGMESMKSVPIPMQFMLSSYMEKTRIL